MVSKSRKRIPEKFKRLQVVLCLCFLFVGCFGTFAFASDSDPEQEPFVIEEAPYLAPDLDMARIMETAQDIKAASATEYTVTDLYNLLYAALRGRSSSSTYSLVAMNFDLRNLSQTLSAFYNPSTGASPLHALQDIHSILAGTALGLNPISTIADCLHLEAGDQSYTLSELTGMIWSLVQDLESDTSTSNSLLSSLNTSVSSLNTLSWTTVEGGSYYGTSLTPDGTFDTSVKQYTNDIYIKYSVGASYNGSLYRFTSLPIAIPSTFNRSISVQFLASDGNIYDSNIWGVLVGRNLYFSGLPYSTSQYPFIIHLHFDDIGVPYLVTTSGSPSFQYVGVNDVNGWSVRDSLVNIHIEQMLSNLNEEFASPDLVQAKQDSKEVIDDTLDNFTGSGSAAVKRSDTSSAKDISNSLKSGLDMGGSTSNALSVFSPANAFWGWFSQDNANYFTLYVPSRSGSSDYSNIIWTDDIPNTLDKINEEVQRELNSK